MPATHALRRYQTDSGEGAWALVTGSTNGMGYEWALQLASLGFNILLHGRSPEKLATTKESILSASPKVSVRTLVADAGAVPPNLGEINEALGDPTLQLRVVVNNIGVTNQDYPLLEEVSDEDACSMVALNTMFPTLVAKKCLPKLKEQKGPTLLVNVASLGAWAPSPYLSIYSGTKAYNVLFSRSLYNEQLSQSTAVDVVCVVPGTVISGMNDGPPTSFMPTSHDWVKSAIASLAPSGWFGGGGRPPPVVVPWGPHSRGLKFLNMMPTGLGDKMTRNFVAKDRNKKRKEKEESGAARQGEVEGGAPQQQ